MSKHFCSLYHGVGSKKASKGRIGNPGCKSRPGWSQSHFECNGVAAFINDSNPLLLLSDKFSSIFPYLFKICQWLLSVFFFLFFFFHLSFVTSAVCVICGQQCYCPAKVPSVVKDFE